MKRTFAFQKIEQFSYCLMGLIPFLLAVYLIIHTEVEITPTILLVAAGALLAQLMGFIILGEFKLQVHHFWLS